MQKKSLWVLLTVLLLAGCSGYGELEMASFRPGGRNGAPKGWRIDKDSAYSGTVETIVDPNDDDYDDFVVVFNVSDGKARMLGGDKYRVKAGDVIEVEAEMRGNGRAGIGFLFYDGGTTSDGKKYRVFEEESAVFGKTKLKKRFMLDPSELGKNTTGKIRLIFTVSSGEVQLEEIEGERFKVK